MARLRWRNDRAAAQIGLDTLSDDQWIAHFARFEPLPGNLPRPLALRYHGHQFGQYNPELGDGRGFSFAQCRADDGRWLELGTKGSGQTPYSRFGDGRLTLKGAVRELLASEMLEALGVPTSRTLSIIETGEALVRGDEPSPTRSAVLVRQSHGHIRIGSFQRLAYLGEATNIEALARYCLTSLYGMADDCLSASEVAVTLLGEACGRIARLAASYMVAGFVHGVLNSDNISLSGESFDYGPWRFAPTWDAAFTAAYFDHGSLYAFGRQPAAIHWNLGQLAVSLRAISDAEPLIDSLNNFGDAYRGALGGQLCWRLGYAARDLEADAVLARALEAWLVTSQIGIDAAFIRWSAGGARDGDGADGDGRGAAALTAALYGRTPVRAPWWDDAPPQSMHIERVEAIWAAIDSADDWQPLYDAVGAIRAMGSALGPSPAQQYVLPAGIA